MPVCRRFQIEEQTERRGKSERSVKVRHIRFFPVTDKRTGDLRYGRFKFTLLKMVLNDGQDEFVLTWKGSDRAGGTFKLKYPPGKEQWDIERCIETGRPIKNRRGEVIPDFLAPKVRLPGEVAEFDIRDGNWSRVAAVLTTILGEDLMVQVLYHFITRIEEVL